MQGADAKETSLLGCVLAGGLSSRMGQNKAYIRVHPGSPTFLEHVYGTLAACVEECVVVSRKLVSLPFPLLLEKEKRMGPLGGILTGLRQSERRQKKGILALAVDLPFLSERVVRELLTAYGRCAQEKAQIAIGMKRGGERWKENLIAVYTLKSLPFLEYGSTHGEYSLRRLIPDEDVHMVWLDESRAGEIMNVNSPKDLEEARKRS